MPSYTGPKGGIYAIRNKHTGCVYVGSTTVGIKKRWSQHRSELVRGVHSSRKLQEAWDKDGLASFEVIVLASWDDRRSLQHEPSWLRYFNGLGILYNQQPGRVDLHEDISSMVRPISEYERVTYISGSLCNP